LRSELKQAVTVSLSCCIFAALSASSAFALPGKKVQPEVIGNGIEREKPIILSQPIELPDFAVFPGKNTAFKGGWQFTKLPGASAVIMQFACKDKPQAVLDWYRGQFDANKWNLKSTNESSIRATSRTGHMCDINLLSARSGETCRYQINYKIVDKALHR
jgi:hypothetical protein